jgi:hypothetical protein
MTIAGEILDVPNYSGSLDLCARVEAKMWKVVDREAYIRALQDIIWNRRWTVGPASTSS